MPPWLLDDLLITLQTSSSFQADTLWNNKTICQHIHFWFWPMPIQNHNCCNFKKRRWIFSSKSTDFSASRADTLVQENRVIFNILDVSVNLQSQSKNISHDIHCSSEFAIAEQRCIILLYSTTKHALITSFMTNVVFASFYTSYLNTVAKYVHWNSNFQGTQKVRLLNKSLPRILLGTHISKWHQAKEWVFKIYDERVVHYTISCIIRLVGWWNEDFKSLEASSWSFLEMQVLLWRRYVRTHQSGSWPA